MAFESIVVHIDHPAACERRMEIGARMAQRFGGRLVGVYATPNCEMEYMEPAVLPPLDAARRIEEREARQRAEGSLRRIASSCEVGDVEFRFPEGDSIDAAMGEMRCADLAVLGQPDRKNDPTGFARRLAESVTLGCGGPVLLVPYAMAGVQPGGHVLVAWDGGREAARAVRDALPLLRSAKRVSIVSVAEGRVALDALKRSHERLRAYLTAAGGVEARFKFLETAPHETGEAMLSQASNIGADLIVMGAYGHARVRELVLGGVTRTMFEAMTIPVLMSH
jgi:nucleotide-binding universal stress UspA family protein